MAVTIPQDRVGSETGFRQGKIPAMCESSPESPESPQLRIGQRDLMAEVSGSIRTNIGRNTDAIALHGVIELGDLCVDHGIDIGAAEKQIWVSHCEPHRL